MNPFSSSNFRNLKSILKLIIISVVAYRLFVVCINLLIAVDWCRRGCRRRLQHFGIGLRLDAFLVRTDIVDAHVQPAVDPRERLPMAEQKHLANAFLDVVLDACLEAPDLERRVDQLVGAHDGRIVAPALDQGAAICVQVIIEIITLVY